MAREGRLLRGKRVMRPIKVAVLVVLVVKVEPVRVARVLGAKESEEAFLPAAKGRGGGWVS